jgi:hypothetical protein
MRRLLIALLVLGFAASAAAQTPVYPRDSIVQVLNEVKAACPGPWATAHRENDARRWDYIIHASARLYAASGGSVGGNWKRGNVGDLSMDGVTFKATDGRFYFADVIVGAGGSNPSLAFNVTGEAPAHGFVSADALPRPVEACATPQPPTGPQPPVTAPVEPVDLKAALEAIAGLRKEVAALSDQVSSLMDRLARVANDANAAASAALNTQSIAQNMSDRLAVLESRPIPNVFVSNRLPIIGTITLRAQ